MTYNEITRSILQERWFKTTKLVSLSAFLLLFTGRFHAETSQTHVYVCPPVFAMDKYVLLVVYRRIIKGSWQVFPEHSPVFCYYFPPGTIEDCSSSQFPVYWMEMSRFFGGRICKLIPKYATIRCASDILTISAQADVRVWCLSGEWPKCGPFSANQNILIK